MLDGSSIIDNLPGIIPRDPSSVIKRYIDAHDDEVDEYEKLLDMAKASHQIDNATGGEYASGSVEFTVTSGAISKIPEGTKVEAVYPTYTLVYETVEDESVGASGGTFWGEDWNTLNWAQSPTQSTVTVQATVQAVETGTRYNIPAADIDNVINPPPGVQSVSGVSDMTGGVITDLDRIGNLFGPLGDRGVRGDEQYRSYLKSLVPAFNGRGTIPGIKSAVAVALGVDESDIEIDEHFQDVEYSIILKDWQQHNGSTVEEVADLADASVSRLRRTRYRNPEEIGIDDSVDITEGLQVGDGLTVSDTASANRRGVTDILGVDDVVAVDANTQSLSEAVGIDETVAIDANKPLTIEDDVSINDESFVDRDTTTSSDEVTASESVTRTVESVHWETSDWNSMHWAVEQ